MLVNSDKGLLREVGRRPLKVEQGLMGLGDGRAEVFRNAVARLVGPTAPLLGAAEVKRRKAEGAEDGLGWRPAGSRIP